MIINRRTQRSFPVRYPIRNVITELNPLAYWPMADKGELLLDARRLNRLTVTGATPKPVGFYFDGTDDRCAQPIIASGSGGTYRMATINGGAFFWSVGGDLSSYLAPSLNNKPYMLILTDSGGKKAGGYIGGTGGAETLGDEAITNGDFTSWTDDKPNNWTTTEQASGNVHENPAGECQFIRPGAGDQAYISKTLSLGKLYKYSMEVTARASGSVTVQGSSSTPLYLTLSSVQVYSGYLTLAANTGFFLFSQQGTDLTVDDVSLLPVTDAPRNESVKLYATRTGSDQNLAWSESGFLPNSISSWEIYRSDFHITGALSAGCWIKCAAQEQKAFLGKYNGSLTRSWSIRTGAAAATGTDKLRVLLSSAGTSAQKIYDSSKTVCDSTWHLVAFSYDGNNTLRIFIDGIEDTAVTKTTDTAMTTIYDCPYPVRIGAHDSGTGLGNYLQGNTVDAFIFDRVLSPAEHWNILRDTAWKYGLAKL